MRNWWKTLDFGFPVSSSSIKAEKRYYLDQTPSILPYPHISLLVFPLTNFVRGETDGRSVGNMSLIIVEITSFALYNDVTTVKNLAKLATWWAVAAYLVIIQA